MVMWVQNYGMFRVGGSSRTNDGLRQFMVAVNSVLWYESDAQSDTASDKEALAF